MQLSSLTFLYFFLPAALAVYYFPLVYRRKNLRNLWLLGLSLGFYAWTSLFSAMLLLGYIAVNYFLGIWTQKHAKTNTGKRIVFLACLLNIGPLCFFKLSGTIARGMSAWFGLQTPALLEKVVLPLGISFYMFKALSYIIDVYRKKMPSQRNVITLGLYFSFFPCAISGPIFKYHGMLPQLEHRESSAELFAEGVKIFVIGMAKSAILGAQLQIVSRTAFSADIGDLSVAYAWLGALAYTLYIYFDFSGYSDMAMGIGKMFGFRLPVNFQYPYVSCSVSEYWRRWHITLGEWFQEYLYYPVSLGPALKIRKAAGKKLGRKQAGTVSIGFTLLVVWLCTGIWHGTNMTFVVWGLLNFVFVLIDTYYKPSRYTRITAVAGFVGTFLITLFTKVIFNSVSLSAAVSYMAAMLHLNGNALTDPKGIVLLQNHILYIAAGLVFAFPVMEKIKKMVSSRGQAAEKLYQLMELLVIAGLFVASLAYVNHGGYSPPLYANF